MKKVRILSVLVMAVGTVSCGLTATQHVRSRETSVASLVWPEPPQPARIRFKQSISRPEDAGIRPTLWQRMVERVAGKDQEERFIRPTGIAATNEVLYVADPGAQQVRVFDLKAGRRRRIRQAGRQRFVSPVAVALGASGGVYVADSYLAKVFAFDAQGRLIATIAREEFRRPSGVAYDALRDRLYVADSAAHRIWVFTGAGNPIGSIGHRGTEPGAFNFPTHLAVGTDGRLYVTDALGFRVQIFNADGSVAGQFGRHGDASGDVARPKGVAVDRDGHIYLVDALFDAVQIFDRSGRLLLSFGRSGTAEGEFWLPNGVCIDAQDRIYVADSYNRRIQIFEYLREDNP